MFAIAATWSGSDLTGTCFVGAVRLSDGWTEESRTTRLGADQRLRERCMRFLLIDLPGLT